ncbi:MAG: MBOAT family protein [Lachnospiraceae bacterium]|nr:MBOAT family protein [Lachnospiraceae bacterium]
MLFNSYLFIFLFFPVCMAGFFGLNHFRKFQAARVFLFAMSMWFYGYFNPSYILIILSSILINYLAYRYINAHKESPSKKVAMILAVTANLLILGFYKYMDFFIENINTVFKTDYPLLHIMLPLGISFFTFQQISFVVDAYRNEVPDYDFISYACFVSYFPQLIAGPIVSHKELVPQLMSEDNKTFSWDNFAKGAYLFILGLSKKVLLADVFGGAVPYGFTIAENLNSTTAWLVIFGYTIQLYFDFSGYCDMAMGIGKMMNMDIPQNFNSPFKSKDMQELWGRWHMTLNRFLTSYVYIPLGGNRKGKFRTYLNVMIVFFLSGLWHGAAWTYVIWGLLNGVAVSLARMLKKPISFNPRLVAAPINFVIWALLFVIFRAESFSQAFAIYRNAFSFDFGPIDYTYKEAFRVIEIKKVLAFTHIEGRFPYLILIGFYVTALFIIFGCKTAYSHMQSFKPKVSNCIVSMFLLLWAICSFAGKSVFLYFNF